MFSQGTMVMKSNSYEDCHAKIKKIYGDNYKVIRRQETMTDSFLPFLRKKQCEITYIPLGTQGSKVISAYSQNTSSVSPLDFETERAKILAANPNTQNSQMKLILDEIKELHSKIDQKVPHTSSDEHESILAIENLLRKNEFTEEYIHKMSDKIRKEFSLEDLDDFSLVEKTVVDWIGESIFIAEKQQMSRPEVILLVGPTGVGKTTTVAKLAADYSGLINSTMPRGLNIRLITTDTIRIGAKEQLETYGELMNIPVSFSQSVEDLQNLLSLYSRDVDVILIDTSGQSPKDYEALAKMRKNLELRTQKARVHLTLSASTKANDLRTIIQQYEIFGYESIIVTKLDETETIGTIVSILNEKNKSIAYITNGQKVPRNFKRADVVSFLINLSGFTIDRHHIDLKFASKEQ